jgi:hypothetical protein
MAVPEALEFAESVPQAAPLQPEPERVQLTPLLCESFCTVAVKACDWLVCTDALVGDTLMLIAGGAVIVIAAAALFVVSVTDVAVMVTVAGLGAVGGAV